MTLADGPPRLFGCVLGHYAVSAVNDRHLAIKALEMALKRRCPDVGLLHHSDQGSLYASEDYQTMLEAHGITCSMSRRGNCYDNAVMESFFSTLKSELADRFESCGEAKMELFDYIEVFYNQRRRHSTLGQISPAAFERQAHMRQAAQATCLLNRIKATRHASCDILVGSGWMIAFRSVRVRVESSLAISLPPRTAAVLEGPFSIPPEFRIWILGDITR